MAPDRHTQRHELTITRILLASRQAVFNAWTTASSVQQWMCPETASIALAELDVRVGGAFHVDMLIDGERVVHSGVYQEVRPPERLAFTWKSRNTQEQTTLVTVEFRTVGDQTELLLTQTLLPDEESRQKHSRGWNNIIAHLAAYLEAR